MSVISKLAAWSSSAGSPGAAASRIAMQAVEDYFACLIAGSVEPAALAAMRGVGRWRGGVSHMIGAGVSIAPIAALANGTSAHALDFDDLYLDSANHPTAVILSALIALGEEMGASGADVLDAYIVGFELNHHLGVGVMSSHSEIGWHTTSTIGAIAAAGACARLMGLDAEQTGHALSLGVSMASGLKIQFGSQAKPLHAGLAAQHGVQAAALAAGGVGGRADALEGAAGFLALLGGPRAAGWGDLAGLGTAPLVIERNGVAIKRFPCCGATHRALDALLELREAAALKPAEVARIDVTVGLLNYRNLTYPAPETPDQAKFSMQYCAAVALATGRVTLEDFTPESIRRPQVRALLPRINLHHHPAATAGARASEGRPHEVLVTLTDGRTLRRDRALPKGTLSDPLDALDRETKFLTCAGARLRPEAARRTREAVLAFAERASVAELMSMIHTEVRHGLSPVVALRAMPT